MSVSSITGFVPAQTYQGGKTSGPGATPRTPASKPDAGAAGRTDADGDRDGDTAGSDRNGLDVRG